MMMMMRMMMVPLPKVRLGKGEPGEGLMGVGKAWESPGKREGFRAPLPAVPGWELGRGILPFLWYFLLFFAFPALSKRQAQKSSSEHSQSLVLHSVLWLSVQELQYLSRFYCLEKRHVKKMIIYGLGTALLIVWIIPGHEGEPKIAHK